MPCENIPQNVMDIIQFSQEQSETKCEILTTREVVEALKAEGFMVTSPKNGSEPFLAIVSFMNAKYGYALCLRIKVEMQTLPISHQEHLNSVSEIENKVFEFVAYQWVKQTDRCYGYPYSDEYDAFLKRRYPEYAEALRQFDELNQKFEEMQTTSSSFNMDTPVETLFEWTNTYKKLLKKDVKLLNEIERTYSPIREKIDSWEANRAARIDAIINGPSYSYPAHW